jgi:type VI secretion system secreted protein VgrG
VGEPIAVSFYPVTNTPTLTPSITLTPTITETPTQTLTPSLTLTPAESYTPTETSIPEVPLAIQAQFESVVTPGPDSVFSPLTFAEGLDSLFRPVDPGVEFQNPLVIIYAVFSYDQMLDGVQWTAVWLRDGELVYYETLVWDGGTGGLGYSEWQPDADQWFPGAYQVQIFVGLEPKVVGDFLVVGDPATVTPTHTNTPTSTDTPTATSTRTPFPAPTITPTRTPWPTGTPLPTNAP